MPDTPLEVAGKYTHGIAYPCSKEEVIEIVSRNGAPADVIAQLRAAPYDRYTQPSEILAALWLEGRSTPFRGDVSAHNPFPGRRAAP
jgi:hypothetical protein